MERRSQAAGERGDTKGRVVCADGRVVCAEAVARHAVLWEERAAAVVRLFGHDGDGDGTPDLRRYMRHMSAPSLAVGRAAGRDVAWQLAHALLAAGRRAAWAAQLLGSARTPAMTAADGKVARAVAAMHRGSTPADAGAVYLACRAAALPATTAVLGVPYGAALFELAARARPACDPAAAYYVDGDRLCAVALRDLARGDEVTLCRSVGVDVPVSDAYDGGGYACGAHGCVTCSAAADAAKARCEPTAAAVPPYTTAEAVPSGTTAAAVSPRLRVLAFCAAQAAGARSHAVAMRVAEEIARAHGDADAPCERARASASDGRDAWLRLGAWYAASMLARGSPAPDARAACRLLDRAIAARPSPGRYWALRARTLALVARLVLALSVARDRDAHAMVATALALRDALAEAWGERARRACTADRVVSPLMARLLDTVDVAASRYSVPPDTTTSP